MRQCKFTGMTRAEYDKNFNALIAMCKPFFKAIGPLPDTAGLLGPVGVKAWGTPKLVGSLYRPVERSKTQTRESARRKRQMKIDCNGLLFTLFDAPVHPAS